LLRFVTRFDYEEYQQWSKNRNSTVNSAGGNDDHVESIGTRMEWNKFMLHMTSNSHRLTFIPSLTVNSIIEQHRNGR
jgi:hypothetical protein